MQLMSGSSPPKVELRLLNNSVEMSVVGFDIGNENCVIAAVKRRGIDVILNDESKRETPAVVSFGEKQRFLGSTGAASATMNPKSTISQVKALIGKRFQDMYFQENIQRLPFSVLEAPDGGILIEIQYLGEIRTFTPTQILAMLFSYLKQVAEKSLEAPVTDCVIGIPAYFSDLERRAYLDAASIAGLNPLRLMHDCTATALSYGIYKTDYGNQGPTYVVFVDIGHCDTQVSVASFEMGHLKIISHAFARSLGGRDFDQILFSYFSEKFKDDYNIDVSANVRATIRLRAACEKLKKVLSANAEAPLNIECLIDERDVKGFIRREEFERLSASLLERIKIPCSKALHDAGLSFDRIYSVELVGSGSRIPAIKRTLSALFKREPSRTLNASECVACGCALQCAMLSPVFRVRDYEVQDSFPFPIGFSYDGNPTAISSNSIVFPKFQPIPSIKMLTFQRTSTFALDAYYADQGDLRPCSSTKFCSFLIGPFKSDAWESRVKVRVRLNLHGIVTVEYASTDITTEGCPKRIDISVTEMVSGGMTKAELAEAHDRELHLAHQDRLIELTKDKKNAVEAYVYEMRNKLFNKYHGYATEMEKGEISRCLQQAEEWLYEEGDDESADVYTSKLEELKKLVDPIENRFKDEEARAQATSDLLNCIIDYRMAAKSVDSDARDMVTSKCDEAERWLQEKTLQLYALPKNVDPVVWSSEIKQTAEALDISCRHYLRPKVASPTQDECQGTGLGMRVTEGPDAMDVDNS